MKHSYPPSSIRASAPFRRLARLIALILLMLATALRLYAAEESNLVQGTVVRVQKRIEQSPDYTTGGSNPSDAPLTSRYYTYEVSIRVDCEIYVGRYVTAFNYLPSAFTADRLVPIRLTRHVMYFDFPNDPDLRMGIVRRRRACDAKR
jgi:hypothetical protein